MVTPINLKTVPSGLYYYYDESSNVIYKQSKGLDTDSCKKIQYVLDKTNPDLTQIEGLTYANVSKISVTYAKGGKDTTVHTYLDTLIQDGDKVDPSSGAITPSKYHAIVTGFSPASGEQNYINYIKSYYKAAVANALANGESMESIYNKLPDYAKYTTTETPTLVENETAKVSELINPGLTRTVTWADHKPTVTYTISDEIKTAVATAIKEQALVFVNNQLKNIDQKTDKVEFTPTALS